MELLCDTCSLIEMAKDPQKEIEGCDLNDLTRFCVDSYAWDPVGAWSMMHPKTCLHANRDNDCSAYTKIEI